MAIVTQEELDEYEISQLIGPSVHGAPESNGKAAKLVAPSS